MKKIIIGIFVVLILASILGLGGKSDYERAQDSFGNRLSSGDFSNMSGSEYKAANDYFDWVEKQ